MRLLRVGFTRYLSHHRAAEWRSFSWNFALWNILAHVVINYMWCVAAIWYHFYNVNNVKNTFEGVLLLVNLQVKGTKKLYKWYQIVQLYRFLKFYKWYQITQNITYCLLRGAMIWSLRFLNNNWFLRISNFITRSS